MINHETSHKRSIKLTIETTILCVRKLEKKMIEDDKDMLASVENHVGISMIAMKSGSYCYWSYIGTS